MDGARARGRGRAAAAARGDGPVARRGRAGAGRGVRGRGVRARELESGGEEGCAVAEGLCGESGGWERGKGRKEVEGVKRGVFLASGKKRRCNK